MKIYVLLMLISVIVGVSYLPLRRPAKALTPLPPAPVPSNRSPRASDRVAAPPPPTFSFRSSP